MREREEPLPRTPQHHKSLLLFYFYFQVHVRKKKGLLFVPSLYQSSSLVQTKIQESFCIRWESGNDKFLFLFRLYYLFLYQISTLTGHPRPPHLHTFAAKTETVFLLLFFSFRHHRRRLLIDWFKEMWLGRMRRKLWWVLVYVEI